MGDPECMRPMGAAWRLNRREYLTQDKEKCSIQVIEKPTTTPQPLLQRKMECVYASHPHKYRAPLKCSREKLSPVQLNSLTLGPGFCFA
ncbi:hypothetical protein OSTOST_17158 [Ostertagia ostertagi]